MLAKAGTSETESKTILFLFLVFFPCWTVITLCFLLFPSSFSASSLLFFLLCLLLWKCVPPQGRPGHTVGAVQCDPNTQQHQNSLLHYLTFTPHGLRPLPLSGCSLNPMVWNLPWSFNVPLPSHLLSFSNVDRGSSSLVPTILSQCFLTQDGDQGARLAHGHSLCSPWLGGHQISGLHSHPANIVVFPQSILKYVHIFYNMRQQGLSVSRQSKFEVWRPWEGWCVGSLHPYPGVSHQHLGFSSVYEGHFWFCSYIWIKSERLEFYLQIYRETYLYISAHMHIKSKINILYKHSCI